MGNVLLVGAGGLGSVAALALARSHAIETIGIADDDEVDETNLHRQIAYREQDIGRSKVDALDAALRREGFRGRIVQHRTRVLPDNAGVIAAKYNVVIEGSDNFPTKFLVADACAKARVPVIHGAAVRWIGTAFAVGASAGPCYRCLFEEAPDGELVNCATAGVMGPMVGVIAAIQADMAIGMLCGELVEGTLVTFDGWRDELRRRVISRRRGCVLCGHRARRWEPRGCMKGVKIKLK